MSVFARITHHFADGGVTEIEVGSDEGECYPDCLSDLRAEAVRLWRECCTDAVDEAGE